MIIFCENLVTWLSSEWSKFYYYKFWSAPTPLHDDFGRLNFVIMFDYYIPTNWYLKLEIPKNHVHKWVDWALLMMLNLHYKKLIFNMSVKLNYLQRDELWFPWRRRMSVTPCISLELLERWSWNFAEDFFFFKIFSP